MSTARVPRVLVVDDDPRIVGLVLAYIRHEGMEGVGAADGRDALRRFQAEPFDAAVVDLMLPGMSGVELCRAARAVSDVPILLLTALGREQDKIAGLDAGADDYVTKPFSPGELMARIRALLRRRGGAASPAQGPVRLGRLALDPATREAFLDGGRIELTPSEFAVLLALGRHAGRTLDRARLVEEAFGDAYDGYDRSLDVYVMRVRKKLGPWRGCIVTVFGVGYRLEVPR